MNNFGSTSSALEQLQAEIIGLRASINALSASTVQNEKFDQRLSIVWQNITAIKNTQATTSQDLSAHILTYESTTEQLENFLASTTDTTANLESTVSSLDSQLEQLLMDVNRLEHEVGNLSTDSRTINSTLLRLTGLATPINCESDIQETVAVNVTEAVSPSINITQDVSNNKVLCMLSRGTKLWPV